MSRGFWNILKFILAKTKTPDNIECSCPRLYLKVFQSTSSNEDDKCLRASSALLYLNDAPCQALDVFLFKIVRKKGLIIYEIGEATIDEHN